jgi:hypothetical protein
MRLYRQISSASVGSESDANRSAAAVRRARSQSGPDRADAASGLNELRAFLSGVSDALPPRKQRFDQAVYCRP